MAPPTLTATGKPSRKVDSQNNSRKTNRTDDNQQKNKNGSKVKEIVLG
jgi:hypothetical protein